MADQAFTINDDRVSVLSNQERAATGFNRKFTIKYTDVNAGTGSTDTATVTLGATPAKWYIDKGAVNIRTAFAGTTAFTLIVGTTSSTAAVISSTSVMTAGVLPQISTVPILTNLKGTSAVNLVATLTNATGGSPSALTAGELDIYLNVVDTAQLP